MGHGKGALLHAVLIVSAIVCESIQEFCIHIGQQLNNVLLHFESEQDIPRCGLFVLNVFGRSTGRDSRDSIYRCSHKLSRTQQDLVVMLAGFRNITSLFFLLFLFSLSRSFFSVCFVGGVAKICALECELRT